MHITKTTFLAFAVASLAMVLTGCGGSGGSSTPPQPTLNASEQQAVTRSSTSVDSAADVTSVLAALTSSLANGSGGTVPPTGSQPGTTVTPTTNGIDITLDYGTGTTSPGGSTHSGSLTLSLNNTTHTGSVTFNNFTVDGHTVTGTVTLSSVSYNSSASSASLALTDLTISGVGTINGTFDAAYDASTQVLTITNGDLTVTDTNGNVYSVGFTNVKFSLSPTSGSPLPYSGSMTINYTPSGAQSTTAVSITITFTQQTPTLKTVRVSVNGGSTFMVPLG